MTTPIDQLFEAALGAQGRAYVPYSSFPVGAAILGESGRIHTGANVENAAYPQGACAEAAAVCAMVNAGDRAIRAILVVGDGEGLCTPCGGCRQRIREFSQPDTPVHIAGPAGLRETFTLAALLPHSFGPANLGVASPPPDPSR